ncbi:MAG: TRAP transporter substrate-binding protein [Bacteroidia bacterium]|nr:TRAP transporter substrate-binding protein [Bacteroidia bacterium]
MENISRKKFLTKGTAVLAGASVFSALACGQSESAKAVVSAQPSDPGKVYKWRMVTTWPPNFPILGEGCKQMAQWVEKMSGGRLKIQVLGGGELVPAMESFDAVSSGTVELGNGSAYYWAGKVPAAQFFSTVPFGMNAQQMNAWILSGGGQALWDKVYEPFDVRGFPAGNTGVQMGGWFNKEINSLADLQGLKMRIPGLGGQVMKEAGVTAMNVAGGEIYTNLERGILDATEWIGPFHDYKMGFQKIARYYYYPGWHEPGTTLETLVNKTKLESLPEDLQEILISAIYRQNIWTLSELEAKNNEFMEKIISEGEVEIRPFPAEVISRLREITEQVLDKIAAEDPLAKEIYESYSAFRISAQKWAGYTEKIYYNQISGNTES